MALKKLTIVHHIKIKNQLLVIWGEWGIRDLCEKISPIISENYLMRFNHSKFQKSVREWYRVFNYQI